MREQNSYIKSVFSAVTAFFLCRAVHYPGALAGGRKTQENELNRSAAGLALAGNYPGARWIVPAGVRGGCKTSRRPSGWLAPGPIGGACNRDRHPAPLKGVFYTIIERPPRARYMHKFTIIGKHLPFFLYILKFSYQAVTLRLVTIFFDYKFFSD